MTNIPDSQTPIPDDQTHDSDVQTPPSMPQPVTGRRRFLEASAMGAIGALGASGLAACSSRDDPPEGDRTTTIRSPLDVEGIWKSDYFHHDTVDASRAAKGVIRARLDGRWRDLPLVDLPNAFVHWSLTERKERLARLARHGFSKKDLAGPHNACVATYGGPPRDSAISLNTAFKGMGFLPREDKISATITQLKTARRTIEASHGGSGKPGSPMRQLLEKIRLLAKLYGDPSLFDRRKQISLELFSHPTFFTHTFLNMLANPVASASFLAYPTFELRTIPQLLHPKDPRLTQIERLVVDYVNTVHDFIHSGDGTQRITCIYHIIEVFEDTPRAHARGKRIA